jgi:hypothetical protein
MAMEEEVERVQLVGDLHDGEVLLMQFLGAHPRRCSNGDEPSCCQLLWLKGTAPSSSVLS